MALLTDRKRSLAGAIAQGLERVSSGVFCTAAPGTADLVEERIKFGATTIIPIGNSGGLDPRLELADLAITTGCVRADGAAGRA